VPPSGILGICDARPKFWSGRAEGNGKSPIPDRQRSLTMTRSILVISMMCLPSVVLGIGPGDGVIGPELSGAGIGVSPGGVIVGDPCDRGTIFTSLKVVRAYRDNEAFAFKHFEGKQLEISGRLVAVKRDKIVVNDVTVFEGFVALVTPDGKPPKPFGLEFRFPLAALKANPQFACDVANLWAGQFVTLRGTCQGPVQEGDYVGIIFNDAQIVR